MIRLSLIALASALLLTGCCGLIIPCCAPSECREARDGFAAFQPIINNLEKFKSERGEYPASLDELVPDFMPSLPDGLLDSSPQYRRTEKGFDLSFAYAGPGMNNCAYSPHESEWSCWGYY